MKNTPHIILTIALLCFSAVANEYYNLTDNKGRNVEAKIMVYSTSSKKTTLKLRSGRTVSVPSSVFDHKTQGLINDWHLQHLNSNGRLLKAEFKCKKIDSRQRKENIKIITFDLNGNNYDDYEQFKIKTEVFVHNIKLINLTPGPLKTGSMKCTVYIRKKDNMWTDPEYEYVVSTFKSELISEKNALELFSNTLNIIDGYEHPAREIIGVTLEGTIQTSSAIRIPFKFCEPKNIEEKMSKTTLKAYEKGSEY